MASINLGPYRLMPRGEFDAKKEYKVLDLVSYNGSSYICINDDIIDGVSNIGILPTGQDKSATYYAISASKGDKGAIADKYDGFTTLSSGSWDYSLSDKVIIKDESITDIIITNVYDGCCGMVLSANPNLVLPKNSQYSIDFWYLELSKKQYFVYTFVCVGEKDTAKLIWNRTIIEGDL